MENGKRNYAQLFWHWHFLTSRLPHLPGALLPPPRYLVTCNLIEAGGRASGCGGGRLTGAIIGQQGGNLEGLAATKDRGQCME